MIEIKNLKKSFGEKVLFDDYSLTIPDGEMVIIRGRSGCGKSTLLHMIGGIEKPDGGEILIDGVRNDRIKRKEYYGKRVGFVFQNFALLENETVADNLDLIPGCNRSDVTVEEALEKVGMTGMLGKKVYQLSGGEQQRIAIARILMKKCDIVLADEPTGSLDPENASFIVGLLSDIHKSGRTVVVVTHADIFDKYATKLLYLNEKAVDA